MLAMMQTVILVTSVMTGCGSVRARTIIVNEIGVEYNDFLEPQCALIIRRTIGTVKAGWSVPDLCDKYRASGKDDVIDMAPGSPGQPSIPIRKSDYISLDELSPWTGIAPIRAYYVISRRREDPDPDAAPSYLPYDGWNKVENYIAVDHDGYEVNVENNKRTGYRFYEYLGWCYLATESKPRIFKYFTLCKDSEYSGFPESINTINRPWINIMERNTVDLGERMPAGGEVRGTTPIKPLIYSDFPISDNGRVSRGRAMCMADCAPGMLMKLLHAGQSIWGPSGKMRAGKE